MPSPFAIIITKYNYSHIIISKNYYDYTLIQFIYIIKRKISAKYIITYFSYIRLLGNLYYMQI